MKIWYGAVAGSAILLVAACSDGTAPNNAARPSTAAASSLRPEGASLATAPSSGQIVQSNGLDAGACNSAEWHWVITGLASETDAPASITAYFQDPNDATAIDSLTILFNKFTGGVAHYTLPVALAPSGTLVAPGARTSMPPGTTYNRFNLSHRPCGGGGGGSDATLSVFKTADVSYDRNWTWHIAKSAAPTDISVPSNGVASTKYTVTVSRSSTDENFGIKGDIIISNPSTVAITGIAVTDNGYTITCDDNKTASNFSLDAGTFATCHYAGTLGSETDGTNKATAAGKAYAGTADEKSVSADGFAPYTFNGVDPTNQKDRCVKLSDTYSGAGLPAQVCADDATLSWDYTRTFPTSVGKCGLTKYDNTATVSTLGGATIEPATASVNVTVQCGCTPGYWKNNTSAAVWGPTALTTGTSLNASSAFGATPLMDNVGGKYTYWLGKQTTAMGASSLLAALGFQGGDDLSGKAQILLRAGTAALLNASWKSGTATFGYPLTAAQVTSQVDAALTSKDIPTIVAKAAELDKYNNYSCPIDAKGVWINK